MKKVLIISPYFPPSNTPDMQRVRMSLPYFHQFGWQAEVVMVDTPYTDLQKDELLVQTIPTNINIHTVTALNKKWTAKLGFGNIAFRSYGAYKQKVNELLSREKFDLIYFSTTQFAICTLGAYWKKRFGIPYVIDMQDPWHSEYYRDKPKDQQPPKYWLSYRLNKYLEPKAMLQADGLISVSADYINDLKSRYPQIKNIPAATITFAGFKPDFDVAARNKDQFKTLLNPSFKNMVYVGRGGTDMHSAIAPLFAALSRLISEQPEVGNQIRLNFIGTSYAPAGQGTETIMPLAHIWGVADNVVEITERISYFNTLSVLQQADALFIPGSDDPRYTASKIYPYLLSGRPLLTVFNSKSPAIQVLSDCGGTHNYSYDATANLNINIKKFITALVNNQLATPVYNDACMDKHSALNMTKLQCLLFDKVLAQ
ncbi:MAG: glycosyltransferase [Bacteroidota bacterium]